MKDNLHLNKSFEAFNARFLTSEEIAKTFVPPPQFAQLAGLSHSVLLGPRGSGKTTLLKMLQLKALAAWKGGVAETVRKEISYHSIFLGTDVLWGSQLESRTKLIADCEKRTQIHRTSFRLHLALAFLNSLNELKDPALIDHPELGRFVGGLDREAESELMRGLASIWQLPGPIDSFLGLRIGLQTQLSHLLTLTNTLRRDENKELPSFVDLDPVSSIIQAIDLTNEVLKQPNKRWAILCDELEIAPEIVRHELFQFLRSSDKRVIFKFSLFPYSNELSSLTGPNAPSSNNDYLPLELYYGHKEEAWSFCEELLKGMIEEFHAPTTDVPTHVLNDGWFDGGKRNRLSKRSPYEAPTGRFYQLAKRLKTIDPSFDAWLKNTKFDIQKIAELTDKEQAPYRKALPFILTRAEFLRARGQNKPAGTLEPRSRKTLEMYTGAYSLFSITEGNPRIFINLMRPLIEHYSRTRGTVPRANQAHSVDLTIHRFLASLSAIPTIGDGNLRSILQLINVIGTYFRDAQLHGDFRSEPSSTFNVDNNVSSELVELVGRAVNAGALIYMPDDHNLGIRELRGARLRLAYTLAPEYKLPITSGRSINLSTILRNDNDPLASRQVRLPFDVNEKS